MSVASGEGCTAGGGPRCVLVVEDEDIVRDYLRRTLEGFYTVLTAPDVPAAEVVLQSHRVDVILCDHMMPGENGIEFLSRLRRSHPHIPRVLVTAWTGQDTMLGAINDSGVFRYLVKPVRPAELRQTVAEAMGHADRAPASTPSPSARPPPPASMTVADGGRVLRILSALGGGLAFLLLGTLLLGAVVFLLLYLFKTGLGIDLMPDLHLGDLFNRTSDAP